MFSCFPLWMAILSILVHTWFHTLPSLHTCTGVGNSCIVLMLFTWVPISFIVFLLPMATQWMAICVVFSSFPQWVCFWIHPPYCPYSSFSYLLQWWHFMLCSHALHNGYAFHLGFTLWFILFLLPMANPWRAILVVFSSFPQWVCFRISSTLLSILFLLVSTPMMTIHVVFSWFPQWVCFSLRSTVGFIVLTLCSLHGYSNDGQSCCVSHAFPLLISFSIGSTLWSFSTFICPNL